MGKDIIEWIVGPQLIGVVLLLVGWIQKTWPPKKINNLYGYRTGTSMKNQETWDEANRYSALYMIKAGAICLLAGFLVSAILQYFPVSDKARALTGCLLVLAATMGSVLSMMVKTESHLESKFKADETK